MSLLLLLLSALCLAGPVHLQPTATDQARFDGRRLALLIGPEGFDDPAFAPLRFTDDDARALGAALRDEGHFDQTWVLTSRADTRLASVRRAMAQLAEMVHNPDDTVVVYLSTHGSVGTDATGRLQQYAALSDTRLADLAHSALAHDELLRWLDELPSRRKVLILATCHSGQGKSRLPPDIAQRLASTKGAEPPPLRQVSEATVVIGVCAWNETARESPGLGHDIYTWYLLQALERADIDLDGAVTVTEAHDYARQRTYAFTDGQQRPYAHAEILGQDPIVLAGERTAPGRATLGSYRQALAGYRLRVDGAKKGTLPALVTVEPGPHEVELLSPSGDRVLSRQRLRLAPGRRQDVAALLRQDAVRAGGGGGALLSTTHEADGALFTGELHLPRALGGRWELIGQGSARARWPRPGLDGALLVERGLTPGVVQLRAGGGLMGVLLRAEGEPPLLAPSLFPAGSVSLAWLPRAPVFARLSLVGGPLWYTEAGAWHGGALGRAGLSVGVKR